MPMVTFRPNSPAFSHSDVLRMKPFPGILEYRTIPARAGKTWSINGPSTPTYGPSPRVRGKLAAVGLVATDRRTIPARAGKTTNLRAGQSGIIGPSPRVRGKPVHGAAAAQHDRTIPARAGKTLFITSEPDADTDHPRACGENATARASAASFFPDHPRACGENGRYVERDGSGNGPSPRVRGKPAFGKAATDDYRTIPARAGKTASTYSIKVESYGPSPRVRGKRHQLGANHGVLRTIPARAGKTLGFQSDSCPIWVVKSPGG